jgi:hypothetical protein
MEKKLALSDFVKDNRFELNSYLAYLFNQFNCERQDQSEEKLEKQWIN